MGSVGVKLSAKYKRILTVGKAVWYSMTVRSVSADDNVHLRVFSFGQCSTANWGPGRVKLLVISARCLQPASGAVTSVRTVATQRTRMRLAGSVVCGGKVTFIRWSSVKAGKQKDSG